MARARMTVTGTPVGDVHLAVASPKATRRGDPLPLVVANDGPEYSRRAGLVSLLDVLTAEGRMPPCRVALLAPDDRDGRYAANTDYARAVADHVLPAVTAAYAPAGRPVLVGASLGALSALQAEWLSPGTFGGLVLQSGSFFRKGVDGEEHYEHWQRITDFVTSVRRARRRRGDALVAVTCGAHEENLTNNRHLADRLERLGHDVRLTVVPGGHDWQQWRTSLRLALPPLLQRSIERDGGRPAHDGDR